MRCLRCGRILKDGQTECSCGHFYDNNLKKKNINIGKKEVKSKKILINIISNIVLIIVVLIFLFFVLKSNEMQDEDVYNEKCEIKCEGTTYKVVNNKCKCSNGNEYLID